MTKKASASVNAIQAGEVDVAAVHDVEGARLEDQRIEERHIGGLPVGDGHERRDVAPQVEQRVELDRRLGPAEAGPREQGQTEVDRRRIEGVDRLRQVDREGLVGVQRPAPAGSGSARSRRRSASRASRWHRPGCSARRGRGGPRGRASAAARAGTSRCRADSRGTSVGRRPGRGTGRSRRTCAGGAGWGSARRTARTRGAGSDP